MGWFSKPPGVLFHEDVESVVDNPHAQFIRTVITVGLEVGAKEVVFGVPSGIVPDEAAQRAEQEKASAWAREHRDYTEPPEWVKQSMPLVLENGLDSIPIYYRVNENFEHYQSIPGVMWLYFPVFFDMLRVSIRATEDEPAPRRYIELERTRGEQRRFAEVELVMGRDNALRVRLLGTRLEEEWIQTVPGIPGPVALEPEKLEKLLIHARHWAAKQKRAG
jgi:hypothetical protein